MFAAAPFNAAYFTNPATYTKGSAIGLNTFSAQGGAIVASGTPEQVARNPHSYTGKYLARALKDQNGREPRVFSKKSTVANG